MANKNDRWSALSMSDRADLIKLYVSNGITSLENIKKDYNRLDGTEEEQTLSGNKPTLEEFIQSKVDSTRNAASEKSKTRKVGVRIPYNITEDEIENNEIAISAYRELIDTNFVGPVNPEKLYLYDYVSDYERGNYYQALEEKNNNCKYGFNCIATATDNYPEDSRTDSTKDFKQNFEKYGFKYVPIKDALPGDITIAPGHGMIYAGMDEYGQPIFNYSDGGITEYDYKTEAHYPSNSYVNYRYVGTPELIQQWTEEYNAQNKKFRGKLNSFSREESFASKVSKYPEVTIKEEPWADAYFKQHPEVSGMAIGAGLNGVDGPRRVIINPYSKNINKDAVLLNERSRHYMEESNFKLPKVTDEQMKKYEGTPYQNDTLNVGRTEAARFISGDKHLLTPEQIEYVNSFSGEENTKQTSNGKPASLLKQTTRMVKAGIMEVLQKYQYEPLKEAIKDTWYDIQLGTGSKKDYANNEYEDVAQDSFLFSRKEQKDAFLNSGYIEGAAGDYGLVAKAVGNRNLPVYQSSKDDITRDKLTVIGNLSNMFFGDDGELFHAGNYPTALYKDADGNVYQKAWDLQDYGSDSTGTGGYYSLYSKTKQIGANLLDKVGNPSVRTTGFQQISDDMLYNLMYHTKDSKLWSELMHTKAVNAGNTVMEDRMLEAYEDLLHMKAEKLADKENREFSMKDYDSVKKSLPFKTFKSTITEYYDPKDLNDMYNIFITENKSNGGKLLTKK